ncbi:MAG: YkgJ family cysteine cluster protein [Treponema sp.]|jgi:Fe-S-cluster containining protein|nr:YkgJ family cysteine cluster protein [Treponema sp.]
MINGTFYASGLRFSCKRCSSCCRHDSGFVFLSEKDLKLLIPELKIDRDGFLNTYCRWVIDWEGKEVLSLKEKYNKDCIFWDNGCMVYMVRPAQCKTFPFWESIVASAQSWDIAASGCKGMNTGNFHSKKAIESLLGMRTLDPIIKRQ